MRDNSAEILFQSFPYEALVSSSGMGRNVRSLMLFIQHLLRWPVLLTLHTGGHLSFKNDKWRTFNDDKRHRCYQMKPITVMCTQIIVHSTNQPSNAWSSLKWLFILPINPVLHGHHSNHCSFYQSTQYYMVITKIIVHSTNQPSIAWSSLRSLFILPINPVLYGHLSNHCSFYQSTQ